MEMKKHQTHFQFGGENGNDKENALYTTQKEKSIPMLAFHVHS
jgi:hypothetical protein